MKRPVRKQAALAALLMLCLTLSSCYIPPDEITDPNNLSPGSQNLPFQSLAPTATVTQAPAETPETIVIGQPTAAPNNGSGMITVILPSPTINWRDEWSTTPIPGQGGYDQGGQQTAVTMPPITQNTGIAVVTKAPTPTPAPATPEPTSGTLAKGSEGQAVRALQQRLKDLGYYTGSVDGDYGEGTEKAVKAFQRANGLSADGKAGKQTLAKLNSDSAIPYTAKTATARPTKKPTAKPTARKATATPKATKRVTPTPRPTATPNLNRQTYVSVGSSGTRVRQLQQRLISLGWLSGKADGEFGGATEAALKAFQKKSGLWDDGIAGPDTQQKLFSDGAAKASSPAASVGESLKEGMNGDAVRALQKRLKTLGYYSGKVDGDYGSGTVAAVSAFQQSNGLKADGIAGTATLNALYSSDAIHADGTGGAAQPAGRQQADQPGAVPTPLTSSDGYTTLRQGDSSDGVKRLQNKLADLGYYSGRADGDYGEATMAAVMAFQQRNGLKADGVAGPATQRMLYGTSTKLTYETLRLYDEGPAVSNLQYALYELGYFDDKVNGIYGTTTSDAVRAFQIANKLTPVDGVAGNKTLQKLYSSTAVSESDARIAYTTIRPGNQGEDVVEMQDVLKQLGYLGSITGIYDNATEAAVRLFQHVNGLSEDGIAGAVTLQVLYEGSPKRNPGT